MKPFRHNFDPGEFRLVQDLGNGDALFIPIPDPHGRPPMVKPQPRKYSWSSMLPPEGIRVESVGPGQMLITAWDRGSDKGGGFTMVVKMMLRGDKFEVIETQELRGSAQNFI